MSELDELAQEKQELAEINQQTLGKRLGYYTRKSGPGWLQGAITLGGGSLAGALYLGVISGYNLMWLQPLAMICGVIMLSAIGYVTLSTGERPFHSINRHISPALGWAWLVATLMANIVWCMPQFNLGRAAVQQNLMPALGSGTASTVGVCAVFLVIALLVNLSYESGAKGVRIFEIILKSMVGVVVVSFFLVVVVMSVKGTVPWGKIFTGLIPNFSYLFKAAPAYTDLLAASGEAADWWSNKIASDQRDKIIAAFGTAVGINMTFLLPYSMLRKRWGREHRPLAIFDLSIGLIVPFVIATGCVVIASATQFHGQTGDVLNEDGTVAAEMAGSFHKVLDARLGSVADTQDAFASAKAAGDQAAIDRLRAEAPEPDRKLAAMVANRDNFNLANALAPLTGSFFAQKVFGVGVLGMAVSTIIILMLINGFVFCELFNRPGDKTLHMAGCLIAGVGGFFGPFLWTGPSKAALAIPTSVIGGSLIPIAYFTFLLMMNSRHILGDAMPRGRARVVWNVLMIGATSIATFGSVWVLRGKAASPDPLLSNVATGGLVVLVVLFVLGIWGFMSKSRSA